MMDKLIAVLCCLALFVTISHATPLDDYVNQFDPNYKFDVLDWTYKGEGYTLYCINMTSQKWLTENDTNNPYWYHAITVAVPDELKIKDTAFFYIIGGGNDPNFLPDPINDDDNKFISLLAASTGTIAANIRNIPNQPIIFSSDPNKERRTEDAIIAFGWRVFLDTNNPLWLPRLPMTKAVVRGFDTLASFGQKFGASLNKFMIAGRSKRGWTTWTTAAVDKRVIAMAPIVMDLLNFVPNMKHHYRSLGGYTVEFADYYNQSITERLDDPQIKNMTDIIDPYSYKDRYTIPKYIITTSCDEFFLPDDSYYYFNDLPTDKYLNILPNAEHSLKNHWISLFFSLRSFYLSVLHNYTRPTFRWERSYTNSSGSLTLYTDSTPLTVEAYFADTVESTRRDFRAVKQDPNGPPGQEVLQPTVYAKAPVKKINDNQYVAEFNNPKSGYRAFYIQVTFQGPEDSVFEFSTEAQILPNTFPFPECHGKGCKGTLV